MRINLVPEKRIPYLMFKISKRRSAPLARQSRLGDLEGIQHTHTERTKVGNVSGHYG